jgi:hypothetical protein
MQVTELSETGVWRLSEIGSIFCQTPDQTAVRHSPFFAKENRNIRLSDKVSGTVWMLPKCYCLTGGVSLGRASPDTRTKSTRRGAI